MITADTSAWVDYLGGVDSQLTRHMESVIKNKTLVMAMPVLFEILSGARTTSVARTAMLATPRLEILPGFWERAGELRAALLKKNLKAKPMDCLIAQSCIDHDLVLIAADEDFRHFVKHGLKLA